MTAGGPINLMSSSSSSSVGERMREAYIWQFELFPFFACHLNQSSSSTCTDCRGTTVKPARSHTQSKHVWPQHLSPTAVEFTQPLRSFLPLTPHAISYPLYIPYSTTTRAPSWHVCLTFMHVFLNSVATQNGTELCQSLWNSSFTPVIC